MIGIEGIVFDKDGTLFDFQATWGGFALAFLRAEAAGDVARLDRMASILRFDLATARFHPDSPVIAETSQTVARLLAAGDPLSDPEALTARMNAAAARAPQVPAAPLAQVLGDLRARGHTLGVATNDAEASARAHLAAAGIADHFAFVAGYDSGHGAKPATGQLDAFAATTGIAAARCLMVGDSLHDLHAGRAAGMRTLGVLTGTASRADLAGHADAVLDHVGHLPGWLAQEAGKATA